MKIQVFAILKEYFDEEFEIEIEEGSTPEEIKKQLVKKNPSAESILSNSRCAQENRFLTSEERVSSTHPILILPPSSGG